MESSQNGAELASWPSKAETAVLLGMGDRTLDRLIARSRSIEVRMRPRSDGRKPEAVCNPEDVKRVLSEKNRAVVLMAPGNDYCTELARLAVALERIAAALESDALERIATALEPKPGVSTAVARMLLQPTPDEVLAGRCGKCRGLGMLDAGEYCGCKLGQDLKRVQNRPSKFGACTSTILD